MGIKTLLTGTLMAATAVTLTSCKDTVEGQSIIIATPLLDAWEDSEDLADAAAERIISEYEANPSLLMKGAEADYSSLGDTFTLTNPLDQVSRVAASLIFDEFGDMLNTIDDLSRISKTKDDARKEIKSKFNGNWAALFCALIYLDGEFEYAYETDQLVDNSFDFNAKEMYSILSDKGFGGGSSSMGGGGGSSRSSSSSSYSSSDDYRDLVCNTRLSNSDLCGYTSSELRRMRNTIYAVHGRRFQSKDLQDYFGQFSWYRPYRDEVPVSELSSIEKQNLSTIKANE